MKKNNWEIEFDNKFIPIRKHYGNPPEDVSGEIKEFIRSLLTQQKQELLAEVRGIVGEDEKLNEHDRCNVYLDNGGWVCSDHEKWANGKEAPYLDIHRPVRNYLRSELRTKLDELEEKV